MTESRRRMDWQAWHRDYDDPDSPVSRRLVEVRARLTAALDAVPGRPRLLNLCAGDARDTVPVLAAMDREIEGCAVELDAALAEHARRSAADAGVPLDVRTGDAADPSTYADRLPIDVLMLIGVLGNISDADGETTVRAAASMLAPGGTVLWTRSNRFRSKPTHDYEDPAAWVRDRFEACGFETVEYLAPEGAPWRLGVSRLTTPSNAPLPPRLFTFVR
ncbi:MAG: class I SAM-dependent methyltransferase [Nocardioides sp.]|nr:class I SAM-dependent methyltransferase [Nocardioides sp.]